MLHRRHVTFVVRLSSSFCGSGGPKNLMLLSAGCWLLYTDSAWCVYASTARAAAATQQNIHMILSDVEKSTRLNDFCCFHIYSFQFGKFPLASPVPALDFPYFSLVPLPPSLPPLHPYGPIVLASFWLSLEGLVHARGCSAGTDDGSRRRPVV